tara:strand:- start:811 stop:1668 length:858 start_codon:yes stop_codon:yes gene_type:complete
MSARIKRFTFAAIFSVAVLGLAFTAHHASAEKADAGKENPTVAIVNGDEIKRSDVMHIMKDLPPNMPVSAEQIFPMLIDQMITDRLLKAEVSKAKLDNDPEVKERLASAYDQILKAVYLERKVKSGVSDKEVKAEYAKLKKELGDKMEMHARHILVESKDKAVELIKQLDAGGDFAELAKEHSKDPGAANGGDLGYFTKEEMVPEFSTAAFALKKGAYSKEPVKTQFGWHIVKAEDLRKRAAPKLEEVADQIKGKLGQKVLEQYVQNLRKTAEIKRFTFDGEPLN